MLFLSGAFTALNLVQGEYRDTQNQATATPWESCTADDVSPFGQNVVHCVGWMEREGSGGESFIHQASRLSEVLSITETQDGVAFGSRPLGPD